MLEESRKIFFKSMTSNPEEKNTDPLQNNPDQLTNAPWKQKPTTFIEKLRETVMQISRIDRDQAAKYYGDLAGECMRQYKPSFWGLWQKAKEFENLSNEEKMSLDTYKNEDERRVVECVQKLTEEKVKVFAEDYKEKENCFDKCEILYPQKSGASNFMWRHSCKKDCETAFTKSVKPKIQDIVERKEQELKQQQENIEV